MLKFLTFLFLSCFSLFSLTPFAIADADIGDVVKFGSYPYAEDGTKAPVEWIVIDIDANTGNATLLSKNVLDARRYDEKSNVWKTSELRSWLNSEFRDTIFSEEEKSQIVKQYVSLLSLKEVKKLLKLNKRIAEPTPYAIKRGAVPKMELTSVHWWLRTPGYLSNTEAGIFNDGSICQAGERVTVASYGIRPVIRVPNDIFSVENEAQLEEKKSFFSFLKKKENPEEEKDISRPHIMFGRYALSSDKTLDPREWIILEKNEDGSAILLANRLISLQRYNRKKEHVNWSESSLRHWLNHNFISDAFRPEERALLMDQNVKNRRTTIFGMSGGKDTEDKVWLLSLEELNNYFPKRAMKRARPSNFIKHRRPDMNDFGYASWWLRTTSVMPHKALVVDPFGEITSTGRNVYAFKIAVRPVVKVNLNDISKLPASFLETQEYEEEEDNVKDDDMQDLQSSSSSIAAIPVSTSSAVAVADAKKSTDTANAGGEKGISKRFEIDSDYEGYSDESDITFDSKKMQTVFFGRYTLASRKKQDPIEWIVLNKFADGTSLLISRRLISVQRYNLKVKNVNWAQSSLRKWLNEQFYFEAFYPEEMALIKTQTIGNRRKTIIGMHGGVSTEDKVYLLSLEELEKFFPTADMKKTKVSPYLRQGRSDANTAGYGSWWLRSSSILPFRALYVDNAGQVQYKKVYGFRTAVRPVIRINIDDIAKLPPSISQQAPTGAQGIAEDSSKEDDKDEAMLPGEIKRIQEEKKRQAEEEKRLAEQRRKEAEERKELEAVLKKLEEEKAKAAAEKEKEGQEQSEPNPDVQKKDSSSPEASKEKQHRSYGKENRKHGGKFYDEYEKEAGEKPMRFPPKK